MSADRVRHDEPVDARFVQWTSVVDKWDSEQVFEAAEAVEHLLADPGWQIVQEVIEGGRERALHRLTYGPVQDAPTYARAMGVLSSLSASADVVSAVRLVAARRQSKLERHAERVAGGDQ